MEEKVKINLSVNGTKYESEVEPRLLLVDYIRNKLMLTGTHIGCDTSQCGSCIVFLEKKSVKSCSVLAVQCDGKEILTVEGLGTKEKLHAIQSAFKNNHGLQCGFCTPGILFSSLEIESDTNIRTEEQIRQFLDGNLCRCTGYQNIIKSIVDYINIKKTNA